MDRDINKAKDIVSNIFGNIFLLALKNRLDLSSIIPHVEGMIKEMQEGMEIQSIGQYEGLLFLSVMSEKMGISLSELLECDSTKKQELMQDVLTMLSMDGTILDIDETNEEGTFDAYITYSYSNLKTLDLSVNEIEFIPAEDIQKDVSMDLMTSEFIVELARKSDVYHMNILTGNVIESEYISDQVEVWKEKTGVLAEFIEDSLGDNVYLSFKEGITEDELVACVFDDTRSIALMDRFEGFGEKNDKSYQRMVVKNGRLFCNYGDPYIHLVIERRTQSDVVGDIIFTDFKKGYSTELREHIYQELNEDILKHYLNKNQFYRFEKPFLLRAQNSKNRSGYGWIWNWKNGVGTYIKGTQYGDTTQYVFVGAYISSFYMYEPQKRESMIAMYDNPIDVKGNEISSIKEDSLDSKEEIEISVSPTTLNETSENKISENNIRNISEINAEHSQSTIPVFDLKKLKSESNSLCVEKGRVIRYKKIHSNEIVEEVVEDKILHKKMYGKKSGDIIIEGKRSYLIIDIN